LIGWISRKGGFLQLFIKAFLRASSLVKVFAHAVYSFMGRSTAVSFEIRAGWPARAAVVQSFGAWGGLMGRLEALDELIITFII
jgi:hypothetical protein